MRTKKQILFFACACALWLGACAPLSLSPVSKTKPYSVSADRVITKLYPYAPDTARIENDLMLEPYINQPTRFIMLDTGTPVPDAYRAGSGIAIIHKGETSLFDVGNGVVQRALEARYMYDIPSLSPSHIRALFITHMHSDHVLDYLELSQTLWWRRKRQLIAFGPKGLNEMSEAMYRMMKTDIDVRLNGSQPVVDRDGYKVKTTEITPGIIFEENGMTVEAFGVSHGDIPHAFGYKITTDDLSIVISGDTSLNKTVEEKARGVDYLIHEVISDQGLARNTPFWQNYHKKAHTLTTDLGKLAARAKPKNVILYHGLFYGAPQASIVPEVKRYFDGNVILANDLDIFE